VTTDHANNAFDRVRLCAALAVLFSHSFPLYRLDEPMIFGDSLGKFAVLVFFALSGYLVCQSWDRDPNLKRFFLRRLLRIAPGLVVAILVTTFVVGLAATQMPAAAFLSNTQTWLYVLNNTLLIASVETLPGTFLTQPTQEFNGSLWTLRYEVLMYAVLALTAAMLSVRYTCIVCFGLAVAGLAWLVSADVRSQTIPLPFVWKLGLQFDAVRLCKLGAAFFGAACLYLYRSRVRLSWPLALGLLFLCSLVPSDHGQGVLMAFEAPYATVSVAAAPPKLLVGSITNDLSYGIHVYAYPIQQLLSEWSFAQNGGWVAALTLSVCATIVLAAMSWHWVEEPALRLKPRRSTKDGISPHRT
jgi:peptidoglycan/LPS O-acetylase OafA/YrhL